MSKEFFILRVIVNKFKYASVKEFYVAFYIFLFISGFCIDNTYPATRIASVSGAWENTATWGSLSIPTSTDSVVINSGVSVNINSAALSGSLNIIGSLIINSSYSLSISGSFYNSGTFTAGPTTSLIFNGSANSIVSGNGTYSVNSIVLNMGSKTTILDVQSANFILGINTENAFNFTFTKGTWKYNNSASLTDCHNNGTYTALTIPYNVVIESDQGVMNLCYQGTNGNVILSGKLFINGGNVYIQTGQALNSGYDFRYKVSGVTPPATGPQLYVSSGSLHIGGGFNASSGSDYIDFHMTGGTMTVSDNGYCYAVTFLLQDVAGGITYMTGGTIIMQDACNATIADIDMGGDNISSYTVTGGTVQFGNPQTQGGSTYFGIQAHPNENYPNFTYQPGIAKSSYNFNPGVHLNMLSLTINSNMTFDATNGDINLMGYNGTTTLDNSGTLIEGTGTWTFNGSYQNISGSSLTTLTNLVISSSISTTLSSNISINGNLAITSGSIFDLGNNTANRSSTGGILTIAGTLRLGATSGGQTGSNFPTNFSTINMSGGTVEYSGTSQTIYNGINYNNLTLSNSSGSNNAGGNLTVNGTLITTSGGTLNMNTNSLISGTSFGVTNSGVIKTANTSSVPVPAGQTWGGTVEYSAATGSQTIISATSYNNLILDNSSGVNTSAANLTVNGTLKTTLGGTLDLTTYSLAGTLSSITNNGTIKTANTSSTPIPAGKSWGCLIEFSSATGGQTIVSGNYYNLQLDNSSGSSDIANSSLIVNGVLNIPNVNTSCSSNFQITSPNILTMGSKATNTGNGDISGIVERDTILANKSYTYGSQFTSLIFTNTGIIPSSVSILINILASSGPSWKTNAIWRTYDIIQSGGSGSKVVMKLHYRTCGLNGNTVSELSIFDDTIITPGPTNNVREQGRSNLNVTDHWISLSNIPIERFNSSFGNHLWTIGNDLVTHCIWNGTVDTNWNDSSNWSCGHVPTSSDPIDIPSGVTHYPTLASASLGYNITIDSGGVLNGRAGNSLTLSGNTGAWMNNGTFNRGTSTVIFNGAFPTKAGTCDFYNLTIASGTVLTAEEGASVSISGTVTNNGTWDETTTNNTVTYDGGNQNIIIPNGPVPGYNNLILSGTGTKTIISSGTMNVTGNFTINSGITYDGSINNPILNIAGNFINNGTSFIQGSGLINFNGFAAQSIGGSSSTVFNNISVSNTSAAVSVNTTISVNSSSSLTIGTNSVLTPAAGVIISGNGTLTGTGRIDVTRTAATADFASQYTISNKTINNLTVNYVGNAAQSLGNALINYGNLTISSNGTRTVTFANGGTISIFGLFLPDTSGTTSYVTTGSTINFDGTGSQIIPVFNYNNLTSSSSGLRVLPSTGIIGVSGTFTPGTNSYTVTGSTVSFNGSSQQNIPAFEFYNLSCNNSSGALLTGNVITDGTLYLSTGSLGIGTNLLTINGNISKSSGNLTGGSSSDINFGGNGASTTLPAVTLHNLTVNRASGINMGGNVTIGGTLVLTNGALSILGNTLTLNGDLSATTNGSLSGDCSSSNIVVGGNGSNLILPSVSLKTLTLNRSNGITLGGSGVTICNILYMQSGNVMLNSNAVTYNSGATLEYDGSYTTSANEWPLASGPYSVIINNTVNYNLDNRSLFLNLTINSGKVLNINPTSGIKVNGYVYNNSGGSSGLVIQSNASGTGNLVHNNSGVQGTVQRYMTGNSTLKPYHYISSPIDQAPFSSIWQTSDNNIYYYDETVNDADLDIGWTRLISGPLQDGQAYAVVCADPGGNKTLTFSGSLNVPPVTKSVTYTATTMPGGGWPHGGLDPQGWNLIGNPYPCSLDVSQFLNDNSSNLNPVAVYFWDEPSGVISRNPDYATRNLTGGTAASNGGMLAPNTKITVSQGFFVKVSNSATSILFNSGERNTNTSNQFFISAINDIKRIWIAVQGQDSLYNEILLGFLPEATTGYDSLFDAIKLKGNPDISLYSILGDKDLVIQGLPPITGEMKVPIGFDVSDAGVLTLFVKAKENFTTENVYLKDNQENKLTDLNKDTFYTFSTSSGSIRNRFEIVFSPQNTSIDPNNVKIPEPVVINSINGKILIHNPNNTNLNIQVYDILGKKIVESKLYGTGLKTIDISGSQGYYIVKIVEKNTSFAKKVFVK